MTRTFDPSKTYYLNQALDDMINLDLATLPLYAPIEVTYVHPDDDGGVWVRSKCDGKPGGYVLATAILDDIPGAAELRDVEVGDRVMILKARYFEDYIEQNPFGIVVELSVNSSGERIIRFKFDTDHAPDPAAIQGLSWCAVDWTLDAQDVEDEKTPGVPTFKKGDKVRVKEAVYYRYGKRIPQPNLEAGAVFEVGRLPGDWGLAEGQACHGNLTVQPGFYLALDAIELIPPDANRGLDGIDDEDALKGEFRKLEAELAEARCALALSRAQLNDALSDLECFKRDVRESVIYQHHSKGWLEGHVNDLLESLELEPLKPAYDGPVHVGSILKLKDGRIAVIGDSTSQPFLAFAAERRGPLTEWLTVADVVRIGVEYEIHDNQHSTEDYIEV